MLKSVSFKKPVEISWALEISTGFLKETDFMRSEDFYAFYSLLVQSPYIIQFQWSKFDSLLHQWFFNFFTILPILDILKNRITPT